MSDVSAYDRWSEGGFDALEDTAPHPGSVWNRLPDETRADIIEFALEHEDLAPRELAVKYTDEKQYFISESSVYRILKAEDLITAPAHIVMKAANEFKNKTTRPNELWQTDFTYLKVLGWGWFYLSTILDDYSRYIISWKLCTTMKAEDVTATLDLALERTQVVNMIRSILREFGHILPTGIEAVSAFARTHDTKDQLAMPEIADGILGVMCHQLLGLNARIDGLSKLIEQHAWLDANARRLMRMPGIGPITASAIVATIGDAQQFRTGRDLAAWLGLTPLNKSSGGKERLGRITKKGDRYIRKLLIIGMTSRALMARNKPEKADIWTAKILAEKPFRLATVAMANKSARIIWAMLTKREEYRQPIA